MLVRRLGPPLAACGLGIAIAWYSVGVPLRDQQQAAVQRQQVVGQAPQAAQQEGQQQPRQQGDGPAPGR